MRAVGVVAALIFTVLGGYAMSDCAEHERLTCDRSAGKPRCTLVAGVLSSETTVFEGEALAALRSVRHAGKGRPTYGVAVVDRAGTAREVVRHVDEADGKRADAWSAGSEVQVEIDHPRTPTGMVLAGVLIAIGLGFATATVIGMRKRVSGVDRKG